MHVHDDELHTQNPRISRSLQPDRAFRVQVTRESTRVEAWLRALRLHQWSKNLLILVPTLAAHRFMEMDLMAAAVLGFVAFSMCASAVYVVNDLVDVSADRRHPQKRMRPFARGALSSKEGAFAAAVFAAIGLLLAGALLPAAFVAVLVVYLGLTTAYSLYLKGILLVDVLVLAGLYSLRLFAGSVVTGIELSPWLLAFSSFLFFSLALMKRYAEVILVESIGIEPNFGRAYVSSDKDLLRALGTSAGISAVLVLALYVNSELVVQLYSRPQWLWLVCPPLLYWIGRMWLKAHRGEMHDDPIVFTIKDGASWAVGVVIALIFTLAL